MPPRPEAPPRITFAGVTDVGRTRKHNEDCLLIKGELDLFCVADGMGGHNAGDVASKLVTTSLGNYFEATAHGAAPIDLPDEYAKLSPGARRLAAGVAKANRDVHTISNTHAQHHGMGSTCVAIHLADGMAHIAHVGDSRCYRIRDGEIVQMTRDHSLINDALDMKPDLTKEELARLPKNIITRALGMKDGVKVDVKSEPALPGDLYLLCSDGLTGMVPVDQILDVINLTPEPQEACELLVAEANDHGGTDNISALLVRLEDPLAAAAASSHADIDADALDAPAPAELEALDHAEIEPVEIEAPPSSERITFPAAPVAIRSSPVEMGDPQRVPQAPPVQPGASQAPTAVPMLAEAPKAPSKPPTAVPAIAEAPRAPSKPPTAVPAIAEAPKAPSQPPIAAPVLAEAPKALEAAPVPESPKPALAPAVTEAAQGVPQTAEAVAPALAEPPPPVVQPVTTGEPLVPTLRSRSQPPLTAAPAVPEVTRAPIVEIAGPDHAEAGPVDRDEGFQAPELEVGEEAGGLDDLTPEEAAALAEGGEIDLDLRGPWPAKPVVKRCPACRFELLPGNRFCVECGVRVEAAASGVVDDGGP